jgi:surfactin synthase thioesterase subunit
MASSTVWLHQIRDGNTPFVFFPPAGSSASSAWALADVLAEDWALWSIQYPARGPRLREPPAASIGVMAAACLPSIMDDADRTVLFGHSFGAYVAYDVAQLLERAGRPAAGLIVAGIPAPGTSLAGLSPDDLTEGSLIAALSRQGGTAPDLLANEELMELVLPALRADLALSREYVDDHGYRLSTRVAGLGGRDDPVVTPEQLCTWRDVTESWLGYELADGDHFFYQQDPALVARIVRRHWSHVASK